MCQCLCSDTEFGKLTYCHSTFVFPIQISDDKKTVYMPCNILISQPTLWVNIIVFVEYKFWSYFPELVKIVPNEVFAKIYCTSIILLFLVHFTNLEAQTQSTFTASPSLFWSGVFSELCWNLLHSLSSTSNRFRYEFSCKILRRIQGVRKKGDIFVQQNKFLLVDCGIISRTTITITKTRYNNQGSLLHLDEYYVQSVHLQYRDKCVKRGDVGHRRPLGSAPCISDADVFILKYLLLSRQIWVFFLI